MDGIYNLGQDQYLWFPVPSPGHKAYCFQILLIFVFICQIFLAIIFFFINLFFFYLYLFLAVLGLRFCARTFSSCGKWGPLFIAVRGPFTVVASRCGAQAPDAQAQQLWLTGLVAPWHVGSSQTKARTRVPCICRQILNHCATREARLSFYFYFLFYYMLTEQTGL